MPANKNKLQLVTGALPAIDPPRRLDKHGATLWQSVLSEYEITDSAGLEMLAQACASLDRAEACRQAIDEDGEMIRPSKKAPLREHPLLKMELASRSFVVRTLQRLNLDVEAIKREGRPARGVGWLPDHADD